MRRTLQYLIGFLHRLAYATLFSGMTWYACGFPSAFGKYVALQKVVCYTLNYPVALVGHFTDPIRGMDMFFDNGGGSTWCDFCTMQQLLWYHLRFSVPVYIVLFYLPTLALWIIHKRRRT